MPQLSKWIQALLDPEAYPNPPQDVEMVQTQMSIVFLTDDYVYKVKKPVNLGYLDYTTLDKRLYCCQREIELNQRLCPDTYLGVVSITEDDDSITIEGQGKAIEYAVKMRRLPQQAMMDVLLTSNQVSAEMVTDVAHKLAAFHQKAESNTTINSFGSIDTIIQNTDENFSQTEKYIGQTITQGQYRQIKDYTASFIKNNAALFQKRINDGRIRDCHGDLHAAHICFANGIQIYDCIEFNDRFRYCDVASEIAFLAMDLDHYGQTELSRVLVDAYIASSQDRDLFHLLNFYKCYRAYVRGKVEGFKLDDPQIPEDDKKGILDVARSYFQLAESYT